MDTSTRTTRSAIVSLRMAATLLIAVATLIATTSVSHAAETTGVASTWPWSGWWWPKGGTGPHLYDANGPLDKYDRYVQAAHGYNPGTRAAEYQQTFASGTPETWAGHCHAWSAAAVRTAALPNGVTRNGVTFTRDDLEGLVTKLWDIPDPKGQFWGTRYGYNTASTTPAAFNDIAPAWFDYLARYYVGTHKYPLIIDLDPDRQVWNFPMFAYRRYSTPFTGGENVRMLVYYSKAYANTAGTSFGTVEYTYTLRDGQLGEWTGTSVNKHPDFAWLPGSRAQNRINVQESIVEELVGRDV